MSRRILLADDSVTIQKVIELTFMEDDYEVRAVGNGDEALAMLTALTVDFVIADVHMPGASGYEVCRRSKQLRPEVPVLLLVGTFEPFDEAQARESGADSYLKKPFDSQELLGRVHELLGPAATPAGGAPEGAGAHPEGGVATPAAGASAAAGEPATTAAIASGPATAETAATPATAAASTAVTAAASSPASPATIAGDAGAAAQPAAAGAASGTVGAGHGIRLTGEIEAAASWQEFELEAEPELIPDPWPDPPPPPPPAAGFRPAVQHHEQPFALGDRDDETGAEAGTPGGGSRPSTAEGQPSAAAAAPASPAAPGAQAYGFDDQPFTIGEPLDDRVLLDEAAADVEEDKQQAEEAPAAAASTGAQAQRATQAEPVSWLGAAPAGSRPADGPPTIEERAGVPLGREAAIGGAPASGATGPAGPTADVGPTADAGPAGDTEKRAAASGNGQPAAQPIAGIAGALGDQDVDRIARRVVELIGDKVVRDIAWEVIPDLAEVVIKDRLRELESQIE